MRRGICEQIKTLVNVVIVILIYWVGRLAKYSVNFITIEGDIV